MNYSVQPPDFWRLYAQPPSSGGGGAPAPPPPPPPASYTQFGGTYQEPPEFVPSLASCGREQLYDERCLHEPPSGGGDDDARGGGDADALRGWPTPQSELRRLAAEIRAGVARLLLACQAPSEHTRCVAQARRRARARAQTDSTALLLPWQPRPGTHTRVSKATPVPRRPPFLPLPACACARAAPHCSAAVAHVELLFVNAQHLAARLRAPEALAALVREYEAVAEDARALVAGGRDD